MDPDDINVIALHLCWVGGGGGGGGVGGLEGYEIGLLDSCVFSDPESKAGYSSRFWVGVCRPGLQIWTPF